MESLRKIVKNHLSEGVVLMGLIHDSRSDFVKVTIDSFRNVPIRETSKIAKRIKNDDNILSMFPNGVRLEVTTPGVGANLVEKFQYEKNIGRKIFIEYQDVDFNNISNIFLLVDVQDDGVVVRKNKKNRLIVFKKIISAKIKVSFD